MRKYLFTIMSVLLLLASCTEHIDTSARYVFKQHTMASYLEAHAVYSEYLALTKKVAMSSVSSTTVYQILTARGNYTCFAPTNEAIHAYLQTLVDEGLISSPSWDSFTDSTKLDSIRKVIVKNSIIDGGDIETQRYSIAQFPTENNAEFPLPNLNDRRLTYYSPESYPDSIYINRDCPIDEKNRDILVINGVLFQMHKVIAPTDMTCAAYFRNVLEKGTDGYLTFAKCVLACGLMDTLSAVRDETYERLYQTNAIPDLPKYMSVGFSDKSGNSNSDALAPEHRKYGFTIFAETDAFWRQQGIDPTADDVPRQVMRWVLDRHQYSDEDVFTTDANYKSEGNLLNQWVTYHILPMRLQANKLVYHCNELGYSISNPYRYTLPVVEWYATMGKPRLLKIIETKESNGVYLNRFPNLDNGIKGTGFELSCDPDKEGAYVDRSGDLTIVNDVENACIYPLGTPIAYDDAVRNNLHRERIRFDGMALFPEAATNGIRRAESTEDRYQHVYIPADKYYRYFSNMRIMSDDTNFIYFNGYRINWANYTQDEMKAIGHYDIMFKLPPVPRRGTYELRYKTLATGARGIVQIYFGSNPDNLPVAGIPIDMTKGIVDSYGEAATWADLTDENRDEEEISEIDHNLRNHGLMKSARHEVHEGNPSLTARDDSRCCRHIIVRQTLDPNETYYVRFKSVLDSDKKELYMDYMEWCPKEVYDNPSKPEDVW